MQTVFFILSCHHQINAFDMRDLRGKGSHDFLVFLRGKL